MQIAAAQKEIQDGLSDKALHFLRNRKKAKSKAALVESTSTAAARAPPAAAEQPKISTSQQHQARREVGKSFSGIGGWVQLQCCRLFTL